MIFFLQVVAAPNADIPQVQAAQDFKELSDKVANTRGERLLKRQKTAAAGRGGRGDRGGRSKSPPRPSSRIGGRGPDSLVPSVRKSVSGGKKGGRLFTRSASSDSSSRSKRPSRSRGTKKRSSNREGEGGRKHDLVHSDDAESSSKLAPTPGSREGASAVEVGLGETNEQEKVTSSPAVANEAGAPGVGDIQLEDAAEVRHHQGEGAGKETSLTSVRGEDDNAGEPRRLAEASSVGEEASLATSTTAEAKNTPVASPPLQESTPLTSTTALADDEGENGPGVSASLISEDASGQLQPQQRERQEPEQQGGFTPAITEMTPGIAQQQSRVNEEHRHNQQTSWAREGGDTDYREEAESDEILSIPSGTGDDGADGRRGPERQKSRRLSSAAAFDFVPTERSLAAFCQV